MALYVCFNSSPQEVTYKLKSLKGYVSDVAGVLLS